MQNKLLYRKATIDDLYDIVGLLIKDNLGKSREILSGDLDQKYIDAFHNINADSNQFLMVVEDENQIIGTFHLTIMPTLTFTGSTRLQIEAVRVREDHRGNNVGELMITQAIDFQKKNLTFVR